jgi:hypothetical protein
MRSFMSSGFTKIRTSPIPKPGSTRSPTSSRSREQIYADLEQAERRLERVAHGQKR